MAPTSFPRRRAAALAAGFALGLGALTAGALPAGASPAQQRAVDYAAADYDCTFSSEGPQLYAGHYAGSTAVPARHAVSAPGIEAQCLLLSIGYDPGRIDGVFGPRSQDAMKRFQRVYLGDPDADGMPGPNTWTTLRYTAYDPSTDDGATTW
ncbi:MULTISPECIES: peptidoglycan-binding protein [unclassified Streptomyces]|uniref:peptidoglycan-binding domain-containing protein n=1 Tax=unclassified Streptomyces TaxID=2593676 RepID=UPI00278BD63E|nr:MULTISPECIES: peptidoglycan-binding domain-containing protein [unclassified Streptomyces]